MSTNPRGGRCRHCGNTDLPKSAHYCTPDHATQYRATHRTRATSARCGTPAGAQRHRSENAPVCDDCRAASAAYQRTVRASTQLCAKILIPEVMAAAATWQQKALCRGDAGFDQMPLDEQLFTCGHCPVRAECLAYANDLERAVPRHFLYDFPVYGAATGPDRARARRRAEDKARAAA